MESKVLDSQEQNRFDKTAEEVVQHYNDRLDYDVVSVCVLKDLQEKMYSRRRAFKYNVLWPQPCCK